MSEANYKTIPEYKDIALSIIERGIQDCWTDYADDYGFSSNVIHKYEAGIIEILISNQFTK